MDLSYQKNVYNHRQLFEVKFISKKSGNQHNRYRKGQVILGSDSTRTYDSPLGFALMCCRDSDISYCLAGSCSGHVDTKDLMGFNEN